MSGKKLEMPSSRTLGDSSRWTFGPSSRVRSSSRDSEAIARRPGQSPGTGRRLKSTDFRSRERLLPSSRLRKAVSEDRETTAGARAGGRDGGRDGIERGGRGGGERSYGTYRDGRDGVRHVHRHEHVYRDRHDRICHRIVWPSYRFGVWYGYGPHLACRYVYPYYLRKYVFVSLGGYWPIGYTYSRYYWYGCHPYYWYGYYPIAREVQTDTYNYYTYNYYYTGDGVATSESYPVTDGIEPVDHTTFADIREKLAQQEAQGPDEATLADAFFEEAVNAFEAGDYAIAIEKFAEANRLAPDDMVLPFAYTQALFANGQYAEAAAALRMALADVSPKKDGVFYPRGLYADDDALFEQIDGLNKQVELYGFDTDLQLLLGYHLLGIGELDAALYPLQQAKLDSKNIKAATVLIDLLQRIKSENDEAEKKDI